MIITKDSTVDAPNVTIAEKTYTAVKDGNSLMLKDGDTLYAQRTMPPPMPAILYAR